MKKDLLKKVAIQYPDEVLEPFTYVMDIIGFDGVYTLAEEFGGSSLYIPSARTIFGGCLAHQIRKEYNGANIRELCRVYGFCDKTIRTMLK